jgi:hypothetical protein
VKSRTLWWIGYVVEMRTANENGILIRKHFKIFGNRVLRKIFSSEKKS